jgi:ATP-grasp domain
VVWRGGLLAEVERRLGDRRLVWVGLRGDDIEPLADLPQLSGSFCLAGSTSQRGGVETTMYEDLTGVRVDPEIWDIDDRLRDPATRAFRKGLLKALAGGSALLPYRPSRFISAVQFARQRECLYLGQFAAQQSAFEHKPWVESAVAGLGLPRIPWSYIADEEQLKARELSRQGRVVLRRSRTSGGQGFIQVETPEKLAKAWPEADEEFVSVAPYLADVIPVNVGAVVWRDGVTVHHPSVQLIGIKSCVTREFGYCGNDFGLSRDLDSTIIDQIEAGTILVGKWLLGQGYLGAFGVDFLIHQGVPLFTEVNPRFQGSTRSSCRLSVEAGEACLMLEHLAAWVGVSCPNQTPLRALVAETPDFANVIVHWTGEETRRVDASRLAESIRHVDHTTVSDVVTPPHLKNAKGSAVARFNLRRRVTATGFELVADLDDVISRWQRAMQCTDLEEEVG